jgi:branched-chain amino acid transport system substrate-binding protein
MNRSVRVLAPAIMAALLLSGCVPQSQPGTSSGPSPSQAPTSAAPPKEVVVGGIYPLTGSSAVAGTDLKNGVTLAVEIINGKHPELELPQAKWKGLPKLNNAEFKVVFADHQADPTKGKAEAERLITENKVAALLGAYNSAVTAAIAPVAERYEIPYLNAESSSPTLTEQNFKYFFRTTPHDGTFVDDAFRFLDDLKKDGLLKGTEKIGMLTENGLWGQDTAKAAKAAAGARKYDIVEEIAYSAKAANVDAEAQRIKAKNPEILMHASYGPDAILFMKAYKSLGINPKLIWGNDSGFVDSQFLKALGKDAEFLVSREVWANDLGVKKPVVAQLNEIFKKQFGSDLNGNSARALQGTLVLADAINRAASTDPKAIVKALQETNLGPNDIVMPWKGIKFDAKGQNELGSGIIVQVQNGHYVTVWPAEVASAKLIYPMPAWSERK